MKKIILISGLIVTTLNACNKKCSSNQTTANLEYLIFGHFYGECIGEKCVEIYKLNKTQLLEDTQDVYPDFFKFLFRKFYGFKPTKV